MTDTLVSARLTALRTKFRQFEHGGHCFGSEDVAGIVRELGGMATVVKALEDELVGLRRQAKPLPGRAGERPALRPGAVPLGTLLFVPAEPRTLS